MKKLVLRIGGLFITSIMLGLLANSSAFADQPSSTATDTTASSSSVLIKVKASNVAKINSHSKTKTGIQKLDKLYADKRVTHLSPIAKAGKKSNKNSPVFQWYEVSLAGENTNVPVRVLPNGKWKVPPTTVGKNLSSIADLLRSDPNVELVEPNYIVSTQTVPNDPFYGSSGSWGQSYADLWGLKKIDAESAWNAITDTSAITVADIDTGLDRNHSDLKNNVWVNTAEIPGNGIDDDGNGYVDDYYGWDWAYGDNDPMDDHGHGTHTAGTIAAEGNNGLGVVGVNWKAKVMGLKFMTNTGGGYLSSAMQALQYAADMGAKVSSNSWGCQFCNSTAMDDAIQYEHDRGMVVVTAAGNNAYDTLSFSPTSSERALTVLATDPNDDLASFSNRGPKSDVGAPGVDILSTRASINPMCTADRTVASDYCRVSGTSMATPHVAGLAALLLAKQPNLTNEQVRQIVRSSSVDLGAAGFDTLYGFGRIDAAAALAQASTLDTFISSPRNRGVMSGDTQVRGTASGSNFKSYKLEYGVGDTPSSWKLITDSTTPVTNGVLGTIAAADLTENWSYTIRLTTTDTSGKTYQFSIFDALADTIVPMISSPQEMLEPGINTIFGTAKVNQGDGFANYTMDWAVAPTDGTQPQGWSTEGISLANGGEQPVVDGVLGSFDTTNLTNDQSYYLRLTAHTTSGAEESYSALLYKQGPDVMPPTVSITQPAAQARLRATASITANAADDRYMESVEFFVDGTSIGTSAYYPYTTTFDTKQYANGDHSISAVARDMAGNSTTSDITIVTVDNQAPTVAITSPASGEVITSGLLITANAADNDSIKRVEFKVNGNLVSTAQTAPYQAYWSVTNQPSGTYVITVNAYDVAGNNTTASSSFIIDKTAPTISLGPADNTNVWDTVSVTAWASDNISVKQVQFYVDNTLVATDTTAPYTYSWDTTGYVHNSWHTVTAIAFDEVNNQATAQSNVKVIDRINPTLAITSPIDGSTVPRDTYITISASASDISGIAKVEFFANGSLICSDTTSPYSCSWRAPKRRGTTATLTVTAYDNAGNKSWVQSVVTAK